MTQDNPIVAEVLDQVYQTRDETQEALRTAQDIERRLRRHEETIAERHKAMFARLDTLTETVAQLVVVAERNGQRAAALEGAVIANTRGREDAEWEIQQLHTVMHEWRRALIEERRVLCTVLSRLGMDAERSTLPPPASLPSHYIAREQNGHACES